MGDFDLAAALGPDPGMPQPAPAHQEVKIGEHKADTPAPHHPAVSGGSPGKSHKDGSHHHSSSSSSTSSSSSSESEQGDKDLCTDQKKKQKKLKKAKKQKVAKEKKRH